jgi:hypothetical protein
MILLDKTYKMSGIYMIFCIPTGKIYVGSAINLWGRWQTHRSALHHSRHHNTYFQSAWNKYGAECFEVYVLELAAREKLFEREQYWIDYTGCTDSAIGFNFAPVAGGPGDIHAHIWEGFIDPDGNEVAPITNLKAFCRKHGLDATHMVAVIRGHICSHQGWTHRDGRSPQEEKVYHGYINPSGERVTIVNLAAFCRDNGLHPVKMHNLKSGKIKQYKGWIWRAYDTDETTE